MKRIDVGDVVFHKRTNQVFWINGFCHIKDSGNMLLNMDMCYCVNKDTKGEGIIIPEINLTHLPIPNHIESGIVFTLRHINDLIEVVRNTLDSNTEKEVMSFITKAEKMRVRYINMY
jgi:hypothetical protein